jgi:hypothetical protein
MIALLAACTSVKEVRDISGETALMIECGPRIERCEARAREACPRGYDLLQTGQNYTVIDSGTPGERRSMAGVDHAIKVRCRSAPRPLPPS